MVDLRLGLVLAVALLAITAAVVFVPIGLGHGRITACYSTPHHYMAQPKEGPGRSPACPMRQP
jgi:hypothetical protein